ncbi:unnamed protein product [Rodentolepis nana]|uniref:PNPLA domain-containing protein n=1 Tax=Rodentolepis nana TaxID=102285 RepID=A0A0R3TQ94_RODNA|nr:unnamed protein product [Rodentolepis nana]
MSERVLLGRLPGERSSSEYNLSFAGCGFLSVYYIGVISCIKRFAPHLYDNQTVSGASAGALAGAFLICDVDQFSVAECLMDVINRSREYCLGVFDPRFHIMQYLKECMDRLLPPDAHIRCSGRLFISMTHKKSAENRVVGHFKTREDLIRAILCSSFIPVFGGFNAPEYKGDYFIDGCFSDNLPNKNQHTITISPFCGDADICPRDDIWEPSERATVAGHIYLSQTSLILNWTNLKRAINIVVPMCSEDLCELACNGFDDTLRFLLIRGIIACPIHRAPCLNNNHHRTGELESLPMRKEMTRITSTKLSKRLKSLSLSPIPEAVSSPMIKGGSRNLLCELTNPTNKSFYHTTFGSRSLAVPECDSCRIAMLDSYSSQLPTYLYDIISSKDYGNSPTNRHEQKAEASLWWPFPRISMKILPECVCPSSLTHHLLTQVLSLLTASVSLQVSAVQSMISTFVEFIRSLPNSSTSTLQPIVNLLTSFKETLVTLVVKGTVRSEKLATILRFNEGLNTTFNCLIGMIRSNLLAFVP